MVHQPLHTLENAILVGGVPTFGEPGPVQFPFMVRDRQGIGTRATTGSDQRPEGEQCPPRREAGPFDRVFRVQDHLGHLYARQRMRLPQASHRIAFTPLPHELLERTDRQRSLLPVAQQGCPSQHEGGGVVLPVGEAADRRVGHPGQGQPGLGFGEVSTGTAATCQPGDAFVVMGGHRQVTRQRQAGLDPGLLRPLPAQPLLTVERTGFIALQALKVTVQLLAMASSNISCKVLRAEPASSMPQHSPSSLARPAATSEHSPASECPTAPLQAAIVRRSTAGARGQPGYSVGATAPVDREMPITAQPDACAERPDSCEAGKNPSHHRDSPQDLDECNLRSR